MDFIHSGSCPFLFPLSTRFSTPIVENRVEIVNNSAYSFLRDLVM